MLGITPARAGKTERTDFYVNKCWNHPRSCGKDLDSLSVSVVCSGSPPLVRERRYQRTIQRNKGGITPARAGKTIRKTGNGP